MALLATVTGLNPKTEKDFVWQSELPTFPFKVVVTKELSGRYLPLVTVRLNGDVRHPTRFCSNWFSFEKSSKPKIIGNGFVQ